MYYIVMIAGLQFKVKKGDKRYVPHLKGSIGHTLTADKILLCFNEDEIVPSENKSMTLKIEKQVAGEKLISFKMNRRKGFRKKIGHRTKYTQVSVESIA